MSIKELVEKIKPFYNLALILIIASIFFGLGRLSVISERHTPIKITNEAKAETASVTEVLKTSLDGGEQLVSTNIASQSQAGGVIGSKSGKKYYYPWCGTVKRIKPENQVKFDSTLAARTAGYTPAGNCKGLK